MCSNDLKHLQNISHLLAPLHLPPGPDVLEAGGEAGQGQAAQQHHEDPAHVGNAETGGLPTVTLLLVNIIVEISTKDVCSSKRAETVLPPAA